MNRVDEFEDDIPKRDGPLKITKDTNIAELSMEYPELAEVLSEDYGLHCVGCFASSFDTIESGAQLHGMTDKEISDMVKRLKQIQQKHISPD